MPCDFGYRNGKTADPPQGWSKLHTDGAVSAVLVVMGLCLGLEGFSLMVVLLFLKIFPSPLGWKLGAFILAAKKDLEFQRYSFNGLVEVDPIRQ